MRGIYVNCVIVVEDIRDLLVLKDLTHRGKESRMKNGEETNGVSVTSENRRKVWIPE